MFVAGSVNIFEKNFKEYEIQKNYIEFLEKIMKLILEFFFYFLV